MWRMCSLLLLLVAAEPLSAQADVRWVTLSPTALNFSAVDPDSGIASASSTVSWRIRDGSTTRTWQLRVHSVASNVTGCGKVPLSAFRVSCNSVVVPKGGNGVCGAPVPLSTSQSIIASGDQGDRKTNSVAELNVQFVDSWRYPAALSPSCSVVITYTIDAL